MKVVKRIIYSPTIANRTPPGTKVVPTYPDIQQYQGQVFGDTRDYELLRYNYHNNVSMDAVTEDIAPTAIGYVLEHDGSHYCVPTQHLRSFISSHGQTITEESQLGIIILVYKSAVIIDGNHPVSIDDENNVFIYATDKTCLETVRVKVNKSFQVVKEVGTRLIVPKGDAQIYKRKLVHPELQSMYKGDVIYVGGDITNL